MMLDKKTNKNRLLAKLASKEQVLGAYGAENQSVLNVREDLSTGATTQLPLEVELCKKSNIIILTEKAVEQVKVLLEKRGKPSFGIRIGVKSGGCSGLKYFLEYADEQGKYDELIENSGIKVLIDPKAIMYLIGTEMDYITEQFRSGFIFSNPNEKGKCGCGSSFNV